MVERDHHPSSQKGPGNKPLKTATSATPRYLHHDPTASRTFGLMDHKHFLASVVSMRAFGLHWGFFGAVNGHRSLGLWGPYGHQYKAQKATS